MAVVTRAQPQRNAYGLESPEAFMDRLKYRAEHRETLEVPTFRDLGVRWLEQGPDHPSAGYYAKIDNRDMRLNDGAQKTACRLIGVGAEHFNQYPDKNAFPTTLSHILDNPGRRSGNGVLVRHDGLEVNAVLSRDYQVRDAYQLMSDFLSSLSTNVGDIRGINAHEQGWGDICSYRVVMGNNLMPDSDDGKGQFIMFILGMSETGQCDAMTTMGTYRHLCTNSAIRAQTLARWDHRKPIGRFYDASEETIRVTGMLTDSFGRVFSELARTRLEADPMELVGAMRTVKAISNEHAQAAETYAVQPTEDNRSVETHYDLFNVLTRSAQDLASIRARERAETTALTLFTSEGGLYGELRRAAAKIRLSRTDRAALDAIALSN